MEKIPEEYERVMQTVFRILSYRDNTEKVLRRKLKEKKYTQAEIDYAVRYAVQNGYLNEDRQLLAAVSSMARTKRYGKRRIVTELYRLGFSREAIARGIEEGCFDELDFAQNCRILLAKRGGELDDRTVAYLARYGYTISEMKEAKKTLDTDSDMC